MQIEIIDAKPTAALAQALTRFEAVFRYPLGGGKTFSISHGEDYCRFFRAMGKGVIVVALDGPDRVIGTIGVSLRQLRLTSGTIENSAYIGDLKVSPMVPSKGRVVYKLLTAANEWALKNGAVSGFGVVMDGTDRLPEGYTGRLDIPVAAAVRHLHILRIPTSLNLAGASPALECPHVVQPRTFRKTFNILTHGLCVPLGGKPSMRSSASPIYLTSPNLTACGVLEDTMRAKRLYTEDGSEIVSAHLSRFAFSLRHPAEAVQLLRMAAGIAGQKGFPALFAALDQSQYAAIESKIPTLAAKVEVLHASVYGLKNTLRNDLKNDLNGAWIINSTEI